MRKMVLAFVVMVLLANMFIGTGSMNVIALETDSMNVMPPKPPVILGDVDGDGEVTSIDCAYVKRAVLSISNVDPIFVDVNRDGKLDSLDYALMKRFVLGYIDSFTPKPVFDAMVLKGANKFSLNLFKKINSQSKDANFVFSPLSVSNAFSMVYNATFGETKDEMGKVLGYEGIDTGVVNGTYKTVLDYLNNVSNKSELSIKNSVWIADNYVKQYGLSINQDFVNTNKEYYGALTSLLNFKDIETTNTINKWIADATHDKINKLVSYEDIREACMCVANAIYFKDEWKNPFNKSLTMEAKFTDDAGIISKVEMMNKRGSIEYGEGEDYKTVKLPYKDGKTSMYFILPLESKIDDFITSLDLIKWNGIINNVSVKQVQLNVPKFKSKYKDKDFEKTLKSLGMNKAFLPGGITGAINGGHPIGLSKVFHEAVIEIDENGTEAAAATVIIATTSPGRPSDTQWLNFTADRPFIYAVVDNQYGNILFVGKFTNKDIDNSLK